MSLAIVLTRANIGVDAPLVRVEAHLSNGLPGFTIVGLPETAVKESKERVRSAILNSRLEFPDKRITINLAPAELPKSGGRFDLAIAIGILAASGQLPLDSIAQHEFLGELGLSGELRTVVGVLPGLLAARNEKHTVIFPSGNSAEAGLVDKGKFLHAAHLLDVLGYLNGKGKLAQARTSAIGPVRFEDDMGDVVGQYQARRALVIAAAGGHNLLLQGPPGTGKTMLANRLNTLLPALDEGEALEVAALCSITSKGFAAENFRLRPFRAPHHTASSVALVGGGSSLRVGEISLAHHGVLFLDELPEFSPKVLEVLREPLESGYISIARANYQAKLPARFQLVAAMNPCPCGYFGDTEKACRCSPDRIKQYQSRVSGPLLDRIDLHVHVPRLDRKDRERLLAGSVPSGENSEALREKIEGARERQRQRSATINANLSQSQIRAYCKLSPEDENCLKEAMGRLQLSARAFFRILKMARTIADLETADSITRRHLLEAIAFRCPWQAG